MSCHSAEEASWCGPTAIDLGDTDGFSGTWSVVCECSNVAVSAQVASSPGEGGGSGLRTRLVHKLSLI